MTNPPILTDIISKGKIKDNKPLFTPDKTDISTIFPEDRKISTKITNTEEIPRPNAQQLNEKIEQLIEQKLDSFKKELTIEIQNLLKNQDV